MRRDAEKAMGYTKPTSDFVVVVVYTIRGENSEKPLNTMHREQLERLAVLPDSEIGFSDIPETKATSPCQISDRDPDRR